MHLTSGFPSYTASSSLSRHLCKRALGWFRPQSQTVDIRLEFSLISSECLSGGRALYSGFCLFRVLKSSYDLWSHVISSFISYCPYSFSFKFSKIWHAFDRITVMTTREERKSNTGRLIPPKLRSNVNPSSAYFYLK